MSKVYFGFSEDQLRRYSGIKPVVVNIEGQDFVVTAANLNRSLIKDQEYVGTVEWTDPYSSWTACKKLRNPFHEENIF